MALAETTPPVMDAIGNMFHPPVISDEHPNRRNGIFLHSPHIPSRRLTNTRKRGTMARW